MRLLCVDLGNLCRGPMAEAVLGARFRAAGLPVEVASAGIEVVQAGDPPDPRARAVTEARGYSLAGLSCRRLRAEDLARADEVLALDRYVLARILPAAPGRARLLHPEGLEIADPYDGPGEEFARALDLIEDAADGLVARLARRG